MERLIVIVLSGAFGATFYFVLELLLKKESAQMYVRKRPYLHPNAICYWRTGLAIVGYFLYFFLAKEPFCGSVFFLAFSASLENAGIFIFTFAAVLDGVDGLVARKCDLVSQQGKSLDPLCDKLTYLPPLVSFSFLGIMSIRLVLILVVIEFFGQFFARKILDHLKRSVSANNFGKIKTIICFALVIYCALLDKNPHYVNICNYVLISCIVLALASIVFKFIPSTLYANILTGLNFACGVTGLVFIYHGHLVWADIAIITGQIFDLFDGRMAEKYGGTPHGHIWDDIADFVTFGLCPAYMIASLGGIYAWTFGLLFLACVTYRLIRFATVDKKRTDLPAGIFNGLPSPAGAWIILGSALVFDPFLLFVATVLSSGLMVSHICFAHFGRVIMEKMPKPLRLLNEALVVILLAYIAKTQSIAMFGYFLLSLAIIYVITGRKMAIDACAAQTSVTLM
ncbi:MAG: CDP-alcohol phosphatidyltransferase family protein [Parcubacteria group bacterium]|jgi:CDP-diacylglycerol--serine O-phosphatidyltransferase